MIGTRLGAYEITAKLGEGGMGEVYRATDTKLRREVAIKVLPAAFTADGERLARFEREAQLLAQLHHPNIASIFGLEESDGTRALVMELVEGPTLADRLESGAVPIAESLAIAHQIAEALEEAHEKGIIHRDLKPQNIKVTPEGRVKVLDFGLAKALDPTSTAGVSASRLAASPTLTLGATAQGIILGTAGYMSPEQAKGLSVDRRADVWAFGVVLFEMLAGVRLFEGETVTDTLAAVLREEVPWGRLPAATPSAVRRLLERCLVRDRRQRLHDIGDARLELESREGAGAEGEGSAGRGIPRQRAAQAGLLIAAGIVASLVAGFFWGRHSRPSGPTVERDPFTLAISLPADVSLVYSGADAGPVVVSPSGRQLAFVARRGESPPQLWVRRLVDSEARPLVGTDNANHPFWAPDERALGYFAQQHLWKIAATGGVPTALAAVVDSRGGSWGPDGTIVFAPDYIGGLLRVSAEGGPTRAATELDKARGEETHRYPQFLPDGRHFLYVARAGWKSTLRVADLESRETREIGPDMANAIYSRGHLLFARAGKLQAQRFDPATLTTSGPVRPLVENLLMDERYALGVFSASPDGWLAYQTGRDARVARMYWVDREGRRLGTAGDEGPASGADCQPALSRDATRVLTCRPNDAGTSNDIWLVDLVRSTSTQLTNTDADESTPLWSPDGTTIVYGSYATEHAAARIYIRRRGEEARTFCEDAGASGLSPSTISRDGRWLVFERESTAEPGGLFVADLASGRCEPRRISPSNTVYNGSNLSPDGRWLAYASNETGRSEIFLARFPEASSPVRLSREGGALPRWSEDGRELYFLDSENWLVAAEIAQEAGGEIATGKQTRLFQSRLVHFAVVDGGRRFLVEEWSSAGDASPILVRSGWEGDTEVSER